MGAIDWIKDRHEERQRAKAYLKSIYMGMEAYRQPPGGAAYKGDAADGAPQCSFSGH